MHRTLISKSSTLKSLFYPSYTASTKYMYGTVLYLDVYIARCLSRNIK